MIAGLGGKFFNKLRIMKIFNFEENKIQTIPDIKLCQWLKPYDKLKSWGFTDDELDKAITDSGNKLSTITEEEGLESNNLRYLKNTHYEILKESHNFNKIIYIVIQGISCEGWKPVHGYLIRKQAQYQGLKHSEILFYLFKNKYEWFDTFYKNKNYQKKELDEYFDTIGRFDINKLPEKYHNLTISEILKLKNDSKSITKQESAWSIYELHSGDNSNDEMYLTTEFGSLYVPYKAIIDSNFSLIKDRLNSYALSYHDPIKLSGYALNHRGRSKEEFKADTEKDYNNMIKPLESKEALLLKKYLTK